MILLSSADCIQNLLFKKILSGSQTVWIQIRTNIPDQGPDCSQRLSADSKVIANKI